MNSAENGQIQNKKNLMDVTAGNKRKWQDYARKVQDSGFLLKNNSITIAHRKLRFYKVTKVYLKFELRIR